MPLGVKDVLFTMRAKDEATRIVSQIAGSFGSLGQGIDKADKAAVQQAKSSKAAAEQSMKMGGALLGVGTIIAGVGAAGIAFYADMAKSAIEYNKQASLTLTQVRETGVGLEQIKDIGKRVGSQIGVPFKELQASLFDIFSSTDLTAKQAEVALTSFSKAAVAGATTVEKASQAGISMLNGFQLPISQLNRVMDVQFKTVQLGRVSYEELASTIGRAIPSAYKAGASIEDLGGMIAFMTRNGLSAAMAATSAARAFDLMSNPKFGVNLKAIGVTALDAHGNFRPMVDIVEDLQKKLGKLNEGDRAKALKELTLGAGGTIQAMRFLDEAVRDNDHNLRSFTEQIGTSAGAMDEAYKTMADTPAAKLQQLKNNWQILRIEIGDAVIPVINKIVETILPLIQGFNNLNPGIKQAVIYFGMVSSALLVLIGVIIAVAGAIMVVNGAIAILEISLLPLTLIIFGITAAFIALAAGVYLVITHFDWIQKQSKKVTDSIGNDLRNLAPYLEPIKKLWQDTWNGALQAFYGFQIGYTTGIPDILDGNGKIGESFVDVGIKAKSFVDGWNTLWQDALRAYYSFQVGFSTGQATLLSDLVGIELLFTALGAAFKFVGDTATTVFTFIGQVLSTLFSSWFGPIFGAIANIIMNVVVPAFIFLGEIIFKTIQIITTIMVAFGTIFGTVLYMIVNLIWVVLKPAIEFLWPIFKWQFDKIADGAKVFWNGGVMPVFNALKALWSDVMGAVSSEAERAWNNTERIVKGGINNVIGLINGLINSSGRGLNMVIDAYNKVPGVSKVDHVDLPNIPKLHSGGMVDSAYALNSNEVLRVLTVGEGVLNPMAVAAVGGSEGVDALNSGSNIGTNSTQIIIGEGAIQIAVSNGDPKEVENAVYNALRKLSNQVKAS